MLYKLFELIKLLNKQVYLEGNLVIYWHSQAQFVWFDSLLVILHTNFKITDLGKYIKYQVRKSNNFLIQKFQANLIFLAYIVNPLLPRKNLVSQIIATQEPFNPVLSCLCCAVVCHVISGPCIYYFKIAQQFKQFLVRNAGAQVINTISQSCNFR